MRTIINLALSVLFVLSMNAYGATRVDEEGKDSKSFAVTKGGQLEVSVSNGDIELSTWEKDEVNVVVDGIDEEDMDYVKITQSGNTVRVEYRPRWNSSGDVLFRISLPAQFDADVRTSGGNIEVRGTMKGKLTGSTSGGDIRTADIEGTMDMKTSGGNIELGTVSGEAEVKTSGGDIKVEKVGKSLKASTSGGDVEVGDVGGDAALSTSGGEVKVGKVSGSATLRTAGGDIELRSASGDCRSKDSRWKYPPREHYRFHRCENSGRGRCGGINPERKGTQRIAVVGRKCDTVNSFQRQSNHRCHHRTSL